MTDFLAGEWWWVVPLAVVVLGICLYVGMTVLGLIDWMDRGSH